MDDLISRQGVLRKMNSVMDIPDVYYLPIHFKEWVIDEMPTIDAVQVVRCKDCKHYTEPNIEYCELYGAMILWNKDDFCSRGERREE